MVLFVQFLPQLDADLNALHKTKPLMIPAQGTILNTYRNFNDLPLMLSVPEVAKVLGISRAGAYELIRSAGFPHIKIGNRIVVPRDKFFAWLNQQSEVSE